MERDLIITSQLSNINLVREFLDQIFIESGLKRSFFNRFFLGISEAVSNSIIHGNCLQADKNVFIKICWNEEFLQAIVKDEGHGFSYEELRDPTSSENLLKESGRGIHLIRSMADRVEFLESGTKVIIKYYFI